MERNEVVVLAEPEERLVGLGAALEAEGKLVATCLSDPGALVPRVKQRRPSALVVALGEKADLFLDAVESLPTPRPPFVALGPEESGKTVLRALRLGARHYLPLDCDAERLRGSLTELGVSGTSVDERAAACPVVAVLGAKGGAGATLVASQLALSLRGLGSRATLVDLNLRHGDAALYLDLQPDHTLADLEQRDGDLDATWLRTVLQRHPSGTRLLAAPTQPEDADLVDAERVGEAIEIARRLADWTLLDLSRDFSDVSLRALDLADEVLLVSTLDIPSLHHARSMLSLLERLGMPHSRVHLVLNRGGHPNQASDREVREFLGRSADVRLPNDFAAAQETCNFGRPLAQAAPGSPLRAALDELAADLHEWLGLPRPELENDAGHLDAARRWLRTRNPWR